MDESSELHINSGPQATEASSPPVSTLQSAKSDPARRFRIGDRVGDAYVITAILGEGGMGTVYEARDLDLNRLVALKVSNLAGDVQTLRREAQGLAMVRHPGLVRIHTLGQHDGVDFLVMERIHGTTLEARVAALALTGDRLGIAEVLDLLLAITDALSAIHYAGIAHRDLKLGNLMVAGRRVVVTDFGLMMPEFAVRRTRGRPAGSVDVMAPELIRGEVRRGQGSLVDLYALGALAFELLAGRSPFAADDADEVFQGHLDAPVPDVRALRSDTPDELAELIEDLLAKSPDDRPECAELVLWRLGAIQAAMTAKPALSPLAVLIVDDDDQVCKLLRRSLRASLPRLTVDATVRPETALDLIEQRRPAIVLLDLSMPGVNGLELCMQIMALPPGVRPEVVAMSAAATDEDCRVLRSLGISRFVPKDRAFLAKIGEAIGEIRRRLLRS